MADEKKKASLTPEFRVSFPALYTPRGMNDQTPKYSVVMLFPKGINLLPAKTLAQKLFQEMKTAVRAAAVEKWGADEKKWPKGLKWPFKDQGDKAYEGYEEGAPYCSASSKQKPQIVHAVRNENGEFPIVEEHEMYPGCYARASYRVFAYEARDKQGAVLSRGVGLGLGNVQKTRDGEPLGGRTLAENDFEEITTDTPSDMF